jgi:hypothetical protein
MTNEVFHGRRVVLPARQASLQKRTSSQQRSHFFRQVNGLLQWAHVFTGKLAFLTPFIFSEKVNVSQSGAASFP